MIGFVKPGVVDVAITAFRLFPFSLLSDALPPVALMINIVVAFSLHVPILEELPELQVILVGRVIIIFFLLFELI